MHVLNLPPRRLVVRADATPATGAGHVMRCATLAHAWRARDLGPVTLWGTVTMPFAEERLRELGVTVTSEPPELADVVLVVDLQAPAQRRTLAASTAAAMRVLLDDLGGEVPEGYDVVWHPHPASAPAAFPGFGGVVLAGPHVLPIRDGLPRWSAAEHDGSVGVLLGAGQPPAWLPGAAAWLETIYAGRRFRIAGPATPAGWDPVDAARPWESLARCERLVLAAGSSTWEAAAVGVPLALVEIGANQRRVRAWAAAVGVPGVFAPPNAVPRAMAAAIGRALDRARPLPRLTKGAPEVARTLATLAAAKARMATIR
jgi:hypothetical protein